MLEARTGEEDGDERGEGGGDEEEDEEVVDVETVDEEAEE